MLSDSFGDYDTKLNNFFLSSPCYVLCIGECRYTFNFWLGLNLTLTREAAVFKFFSFCRS